MRDLLIAHRQIVNYGHRSPPVECQERRLHFLPDEQVSHTTKRVCYFNSQSVGCMSRRVTERAIQELREIVQKWPKYQACILNIFCIDYLYITRTYKFNVLYVEL